MTVLLTGASGFVGMHLKETLAKSGFFVFAPKSSELDLLDSNAVDLFFASHPVDAVVHCAAKGVRVKPSDVPEEIVFANFQMYRNLERHVSESCTMITLGSGACYDKSRPLVNVAEDSMGGAIPKDPYGYAKYLIAKDVEKNVNMLELRLFGVYGTGEDTSRVATDLFIKGMEGRPLVLRQNAWFDFLYIDDLCSLVAIFLRSFPKELRAFNVCPCEHVQLMDIACIIQGLTDSRSRIQVEKEGMNKAYTGCNQRLLTWLTSNRTFFSFTDIRTGLQKMKRNLFYQKGKHGFNL